MSRISNMALHHPELLVTATQQRSCSRVSMQGPRILAENTTLMCHLGMKAATKTSSIAKKAPVISAASLNALTRPAASWPVIASTTSSVSVGFTAFRTSPSSRIMRSSICAPIAMLRLCRC